MQDTRIEIEEWSSQLAAKTKTFFNNNSDFDFKNLSLDDQFYFYEHGFNNVVNFVNVYDSKNQKIGHCAFYDRFYGVGKKKKALYLADLHIETSIRNLKVVKRMYDTANNYIAENKHDAIITVSNPTSAKLNSRFLKITDSYEMNFKLTFGFTFAKVNTLKDVTDAVLDGTQDKEFEKYLSNNDLWDMPSLRTRIAVPDAACKVFICKDQMIVCSPSKKHGLKVVVVLGVFSKNKDSIFLSKEVLKQIRCFYNIHLLCIQTINLEAGRFNGKRVKTMNVFHRGMDPHASLSLIDLDVALGE